MARPLGKLESESSFGIFRKTVFYSNRRDTAMAFGRRTTIDANLRQWVRAHLAERLGIEPSAVELGCGLDQYGLDSVDAVLMAGELETAMDVEIDPTAFMLHPTLEAMIQCLGDQLEQKATDPAA